MNEIMPEHETYKYTRLWQMPNAPREADSSFPTQLMIAARDAIDWGSTSTSNIAEFDFQGTHYFVHYSCPCWYSYAKDSFKIADLLVISEDSEDAATKFAADEADAQQKKQNSSEFIEHFLPELLKLPDIVVIMGRGSVYDKRRLPASAGDDIDLMLFVDRSFTSENEVQDIIDMLTALADSDPDLKISVGVFSPMLVGGDKDIGIAKRTANHKLSLDLLPWPLLTHDIDKLMIVIKPYEIDSLREGKILADKTQGKFEQVKQRLVSEFGNR